MKLRSLTLCSPPYLTAPRSAEVRVRIVLYGLGAFVGLGAFWVAALAWGTSPHGGLLPLAIAQTLLMFGAMSSIVTAAVSLVLLPFRRFRRIGLSLLAVCVLVWPCFRAFGYGWSRLRDQRFHEFAARAQPLVDALYAYERQHGQPATSLSDLIPAILPKVPDTGMGAFPAFNYYQGRELQEGGRWRLTVPVGATAFDWQHLEFRADQKYDVGYQRYGGWILIVG
jgi:hypothetical protein